MTFDVLNQSCVDFKSSPGQLVAPDFASSAEGASQPRRQGTNETMDERVNLRRREGSTAVGVARFLPQPGPKLYGGLVWMAFGLYVLFFAQGYSISVQQEQIYSELMGQAIFSEEGRMAERDIQIAQRNLDQVQVVFWRWREPYSKLVPMRQKEYDIAYEEYKRVSRERDKLISEAKSTVGIWSSYGVEEVRSKFWGDYQWGKDFAKRMTFWDFLLGSVGGRDEEAWVTLMRWVGQIIMNFTVGLVSALVSFGFSLVGIIWAYKTSLVSGILFFTVAFSAASAMVAFFVGGMCATAVGGVYMVAQSSAARLEDRRRNAGAQRVRYEEQFRRQQQYQQQHYQHYD